MATAQQAELAEFHQFVELRMRNPEMNQSPEEVLEEWRLLRGDIGGSERDRLAVQAAIRDMRNGDQGIDFEVHLRELKERILS
jgi:hypothetical protein